MGSWVVEMQATKSIYKVHPFISSINKTAYQPQVVSFGPYHHGEPQLAWMEAHKNRALLRFIDRSGQTKQKLIDLVLNMAQELKDSYDSLDLEWQKNTERFVELMILDGCFMLELLYVYVSYNYYSENDPVFSQHGQLYIKHFIKPDMLMLENQLPMLLLFELHKKCFLTNNEPNIESLNAIILFFLNYEEKDGGYPKMGKCLHVLDLYHKGLLHTDNEHENAAPQSTDQGEHDYTKMGKCLHKLGLYCKSLLHTHNECGNVAPQFASEGEGKNKRIGPNIVRPATELHEAGVRFMTSKSKSLLDITFDGGVLKLPTFTVYYDTESIFLNLIAFERCHFPAGNDITSFIALMDYIIDDSRDIKLLSSKGIIDNLIGSDKAAADLINKMTQECVFVLDGKLGQVYKKLIDYCNTRWHKWRANLIETYFRSPWAIISVIAAFVLFSLTGVQTIFTILN